MKNYKQIFFLSVFLLTGCAGMVTSNDGEKVVIEHDFFNSLDSVKVIAIKACKQNGKTDAVFINSANKNPRLPEGNGVQLSTFNCI